MTDPVPSKELEEAMAAANRQLDEPFADPDDDIRTVARQFLRSRETIERLQAALRGIQSCSTCGACRGAATIALGEPPGIPAHLEMLAKGTAPEPAAVVEEGCGHCQGTGRIGTPPAACPFCSGDGVRRRDAQPPRAE